MTPEVERLRKERQEVMRYLAALVDQMGGSVSLSPMDLSVDRVLRKETVGFTGVVVLKVEKP